MRTVVQAFGLLNPITCFFERRKQCFAFETGGIGRRARLSAANRTHLDSILAHLAIRPLQQSPAFGLTQNLNQ